MRREAAAIMAAALLAGCAHGGGGHSSPGRARCDAAGVQDVIGAVATGRTREAARRKAGARAIRVMVPGQSYTMEFREDRLSITVDDANRITRIGCG